MVTKSLLHKRFYVLLYRIHFVLNSLVCIYPHRMVTGAMSYFPINQRFPYDVINLSKLLF